MRRLGPFQTSVRFLVLEGRSDEEIREHFRDLVRNSRINAALRIVRDDLAAQRSALSIQHDARVVDERGGERIIEFSPGHVAKETAVKVIMAARGRKHA